MSRAAWYVILLGLGQWAAFGADLGPGTTVFVPDAGPAVGRLDLVNPSDVTREPDGSRSLRLVRDTDPYGNPAYVFRFRERADWPGEGVFGISFHDVGAGVIQPKLRTATGWTSPGESASFTRLNTTGVRTAFFHFSGPLGDDNAEGDLRIEGLDHLVSIALWPALSAEMWADIRESVPRDVTPMVTLENPALLTTTAGLAVQGGLDTLDASLRNLREYAPLAKVLGFTSIESYVTWNRIEAAGEGQFDFSYYDAIVDELKTYDLKWFPLVIVGSAYALPEWFQGSEEDHGFVCLEHGLENPIQSIWSPTHRRHVERVLKAFGEHYGDNPVVEAVRLGPSGNYGESQYPAGGNWGHKGKAMHIHIGWWCGDPDAAADFREWVKAKYGDIGAVNEAWQTTYGSFDDVAPMLPDHMFGIRNRLDMTAWYTDRMSEWCKWWGETLRASMPRTALYQSSGGWGFREAGTDYSAQTKDMVSIGGGIRLTNETDSFDQNYFATRLAATAARLYGVPLGYEPASSHTARGIAGRLFNTATTNGNHFFTYQNNVMYDPYGIDQWLTYLPIMNTRQDPVIDVAVYYPETYNQIDDSAFRHLYAWGFNPRAREIRNQVEVDYLDERLIREGLLDRYKVLVFAWGNLIEADVLDAIDGWVKQGGVVIYPSFPKGNLSTIEGDAKVFRAWTAGDTGKGRFERFRGDMEPPALYGRFVKKTLLTVDGLRPGTQRALRIDRPDMVYVSVQSDSSILALNYNEDAVTIRDGNTETAIPAYGIVRLE